MARHMLTQIRRRRQISRARRVVGVLLLAAVLSVGAFMGFGALSGLSQFRITDVVVEGNGAVSAEDIKEVAWATLSGKIFYFFSRQNAYLYPQKSLKAALGDAFPRINRVALDRRGKTISIVVEERKGTFLWCAGSEANCFFSDPAGVIFAQGPEGGSAAFFKIIDDPTKDAPLGTQPLSSEEITRIFSIKDGVAALGFTPRHYTAGLEYDTLLTKETSLRLSKVLSAEILLDNLKTALPHIPSSKKLSYIDLRFGKNKVTYKLIE